MREHLCLCAKMKKKKKQRPLPFFWDLGFRLKVTPPAG